MFLPKYQLSVLPLTLFVLLASGPAFASDQDLLGQEIDAYKRNDFKSAVALGTQELKKSPSNAVARYYVAEALVKLGRRQEAIDKYTECAMLSTDPKLTNYCQQALATLNSRGAGPSAFVTAGAPATPPASVNSHVDGSSHSFSDRDATVNEGLLRRRADTIQQGLNEIAFQRQQADQRINSINQDMAEQLRPIHQFITAPSSSGRCCFPNPEYQDALEQLQAESTAKIAQINADFEKRKADITNDYNRRADAYGVVVSETSAK